ncbi:MAG: histidine phosphatase family protein [Pseudomonadota bacterium]
MKTLVVMRHAKSRWGDPQAADIDRPLNKRGMKSAKAIGDWLAKAQAIPDLVLCSSARRTAQTWENTGLNAEIRFLPTLYHASPGAIFTELRQAEGDCVLVLGHNPGIAFFAGMVIDGPPQHQRFGDYPTAATLIADYDGEWPDIAPAKAKARAFTIPRNLLE